MSLQPPSIWFPRSGYARGRLLQCRRAHDLQREQGGGTCVDLGCALCSRRVQQCRTRPRTTPRRHPIPYPSLVDHDLRIDFLGNLRDAHRYYLGPFIF